LAYQWHPTSIILTEDPHRRFATATMAMAVAMAMPEAFEMTEIKAQD
jgi:hypothetical protein